ncbi:unnamed protein product [marine sediment metagenome]|uniref:Uncharacterized protein n=1 Tax=marine sediment metagenome TaxID=412755 RepID=X1EFH1_9ZZZZ
MFGGIERGDAWEPAFGMPPNGYFDLTNDEVFPCLWSHGAPPWPLIRFILQDGNSTLGCKPDSLRVAFSGSINENCRYQFKNGLEGAAGNAFYGGYGHIITPADMGAIIESVTPMIDPDPRMELFPVDDEVSVLRYAGKRDATNIKIKFDTDLAYWYEHFG